MTSWIHASCCLVAMAQEEDAEAQRLENVMSTPEP